MSGNLFSTWVEGERAPHPDVEITAFKLGKVLAVVFGTVKCQRQQWGAAVQCQEHHARVSLLKTTINVPSTTMTTAGTAHIFRNAP